MNFLQRQFVHEIPHGDHEISHGETMRYLMVPWEVSPWDHENLSWWGGAKSFIMRTSHGIMRNLRVSPWDFSLYHEMFSWWMFLLPPPPPTTRGSRGLMVRILIVPWDISWFHHENSHGTMRYLMVSPWDPESILTNKTYNLGIEGRGNRGKHFRKSYNSF